MRLPFLLAYLLPCCGFGAPLLFVPLSRSPSARPSAPRPIHPGRFSFVARPLALSLCSVHFPHLSSLACSGPRLAHRIGSSLVCWLDLRQLLCSYSALRKHTPLLSPLPFFSPVSRAPSAVLSLPRSPPFFTPSSSRPPFLSFPYYRQPPPGWVLLFPSCLTPLLAPLGPLLSPLRSLVSRLSPLVSRL